MKLIEHRWVQVIWCDDVRHEIGNKPSFMGVYTGDMQLPSLPIVLPKLAVHINVATPRDKLFKQLKIRLLRNDSPASVAEIAMPAEDLSKMNEEILSRPLVQDDEKPDEPTGISIAFLVIVGPLMLNATTKWLKVFVDTESETLESFKLRISSQVLEAHSLH